MGLQYQDLVLGGAFGRPNEAALRHHPMLNKPFFRKVFFDFARCSDYLYSLR